MEIGMVCYHFLMVESCHSFQVAAPTDYQPQNITVGAYHYYQPLKKIFFIKALEVKEKIKELMWQLKYFSWTADGEAWVSKAKKVFKLHETFTSNFN